MKARNRGLGAGLGERLSRLAAFGTATYPPRTARRLRVINLTALIAGAITLSFAAFFALYDFSRLGALIALNAVGGVLSLLVPLLHRFGSLAAALAFLVSLYVGLFLAAYLLGADAGIQLYFIPAAAGAVLFFGVERPWLVIASVAIAAMLHVAARFLFPAGAAVIPLDPQLLDGIYVASAVMSFALLLTVVFYAFQQLGQAEAAAEREYRRSESLLANILPDPIAERLKDDREKVIADSFDTVTVLFADIVGFTAKASDLPPAQLVTLLNRTFSAFDELVDRYGLEKIKTIGDAYMVAGGLPAPRADHAVAVADMALDMMQAAAALSDEDRAGQPIRIGIHSGPAVAGVIGTRKFSYDVWGDTVNVAARMESQGVPGRIQVSPAAQSLLKDHFIFEKRGAIDVRGKGRLETYFLTGRKGERR